MYMYTDMYYMYMYSCLSSLQGNVLLSVETFTFSTNIFQFDLYNICIIIYIHIYIHTYIYIYM